MHKDTLKFYCCPACRAEKLSLRIDKETREGEVDEGGIDCIGCGKSFPIVRALPRFVPQSNYADSFGLQWNIHARTQLDSHSKLPISRARVFEVTGWGSNLQGQRLLEAGSGAGRFTEVLAKTGAEILSFDYSSAVDANQSNNGGATNLQIFQGDIFNIPLKEGAFDKVFCLGVLQHTPDPFAAFQSLTRYVRPGGQLVVDAYTRNLAALLQWKYVLRPITKRMDKKRLYRAVEAATPFFIPAAKWLRKVGGRAGARLVPIVEYSHLGLEPELNKQWAILDTFDMYSPAHDHPQSLATVRNWFESAGFEEIEVRYGPNGVVGRGVKKVVGHSYVPAS